MNNDQKLGYWEKILAFLWETLKIVVVSLLIIVPIRYFVIQPFFVQGASMEPNFENGEYLLVDEITYRFRDPHRFEVVVFRYPKDPAQFFIKRIIGLPGETVEIKEGQVVIYNKQNPLGFVLDESLYLPAGALTSGELKIKLDPNEYFVLGDNRNSSSDSRRWGPLKRNLIIGRVWVRAFPFERVAIFSTP